MPLLPDDERLLHHALNLAEGAAAFASPNPAVGCVLTRGGQLLGEGAHRYDLRDHAEIVALKHAAGLGHHVAGANAYVTLEPCSHHGRTGPCADALIAAGIARCVVATVDPNPQVRGEGLRRLRGAGVEVVLAEPSSAVAQRARHLNDAFAFSVQHLRPFITLKSALSADGKLAPPASERTATAPHWLTGEAARADVGHLRHASDAILTGIGTVLADNPSLTDRTDLPRRRPLLRIVLDSGLRIPLDSQLVRSAQDDLLIVTNGRSTREQQDALEAQGVEVVSLAHPDRMTNLMALWGLLGNRGIRSVLVEAGPTLNGALLAGGFVDRLILYRSPLELGPNALPFAAGQLAAEVWEQRLSALAHKTFPHGSGKDTRASGYLHDPWAGVQA